MRMFELSIQGNNQQKSNFILRLYDALRNINRNVQKYLFPWTQYDEEKRVVEHITSNNNIVSPSKEKQIGTESISSNIALEILLNELRDRQ